MFEKQLGLQSIVTTSGNDRSLDYLIQQLQLKKEQIINYKDDGFIKKAIARNGGYFDIALDLVGGKMLSACCPLLAVNGNLASVRDAPERPDFVTLFQKNASFHSIGANAYSLSDNREHWKKYQQILHHILKLFDSARLILPPITIVGSFSVDTVKKADELLENNLVNNTGCR